MTAVRGAAAPLVDAAGRLIGAGSRLRGARVFHPAGVVCTAELSQLPGAERYPVITEALLGRQRGTARRRATVRLSKGAGTPGALPDLLGLAVRVEDGADGQPWDLLLASSRASPMVLVPAVNWLGQPYSTVLPYRADGSLVWFGALPRPASGPIASSIAAVRDALRSAPLAFTIAVSALLGGWRPVAALVVHELVDRDVPFDPVVNAHPLLTPVPWWVARFRGQTYARSRRARNAAGRLS